MRDFSKLETLLNMIGVSPNRPTLFLSECVLIYMSPEESDSIIHWCSNYFSSSMFLIYEQINPSDPFGQMMINNLRKRGISLLSFQTYPTIASQIERMQNCGYDLVLAKDMNAIYNNLLDLEENRRANRIEMLDELEEWILILQHYCIILAANDKNNTGMWDNISLTR
eukprot:TRINITY_DN2025_c0_g1_i2.p1 TRINITY_DN2025_c0_g1~~TRINITY_DN2025_c0_g1_i2.p1  ORF type:complete len:168 (-),score=23.85 TRINITY_DN2025_c0_g1_i2:41-544(-)